MQINANVGVLAPGLTIPKIPSWKDLISWMATVITNGGLGIITNRMIGGGTEPKYFGWGTGAGTSAAADTTLFSEKDVDLTTATGTRTTCTGTQQTTTVTNDTNQWVGTRTATGAGTVTNAGLWDNATIGSGTLFFKTDFTGDALNSGDGIQGTFKVQFS